jgi:signal transduction histidine kinase
LRLILESEGDVSPTADEAVREQPYAGEVESLLSWSRRNPLAVDMITAGALLLIGVAGERPRESSFVPHLFLAFVMCAALVFRRRAPRTTFVVIALCGLLQYLTHNGIAFFDAAILIAMYNVVAYRGRRDGVAALAVVEFGVFLASLRWSARPSHVGIGLTVVAIAAFVIGDTRRVRLAYLAELEARAARLERERDQQATIAAAAERERIARELHDIVTHSVSVMVAQADGATFAMADNPDRAREAIEVVARTGREALAELRQLLGVLRTADAEPEMEPQPGVEQIPELVERLRDAGLSVDLDIDGAPRAIPVGLGLATYRIVQEALTNTFHHAGRQARAWVRLVYLDDAIEVHVDDDGASAPRPNNRPASDPAGHGLVGMRERAAMYGGSVRTGYRPEGGFRIDAHFPNASP